MKKRQVGDRQQLTEPKLESLVSEAKGNYSQFEQEIDSENRGHKVKASKISL
jgi:hypothetical protein